MIGAVTVVGAFGATSGVLAAASDSLDPVSILQNFGFPTAVVLLFIFGWIRTKGESERLSKELADARRQHAALVDKLVDDVVPALTRSADATVASTAAVQELTRRALSGGG